MDVQLLSKNPFKHWQFHQGWNPRMFSILLEKLLVIENENCVFSNWFFKHINIAILNYIVYVLK